MTGIKISFDYFWIMLMILPFEIVSFLAVAQTGTL